MKKLQSLGFTLVELLVVMGVLAVLVVTILVSLNPAEAGKKSRDTKRMKDLRTLEAIVLQWIQDGKGNICANACSTIGNPTQPQPCSSNWTGVNLCDYVKTVPVDPRNGTTGSIVGGTPQNPTLTPTDNDGFSYYMRVLGSDYKIGVFQESISNANNVHGDGGTNSNYVEVGSNMNLW